MQRYLSLFLFALAATVAGCASTPEPAELIGLTTGKRIAVASIDASNVRYQWIGTTVFNNEYRQVVVPDRAIDHAVEQTVVEVLQNSGRFAAIGVVSAERALVAEKSPIDADLLLRFESASVEDRKFHTNQRFVGAGIFQRTMLGSPARVYGHAAFRGTLIDLKSNRVIATVEDIYVWDPGMKLGEGASLGEDDETTLFRRLAVTVPGTVASLLGSLGVR